MNNAAYNDRDIQALRMKTAARTNPAPGRPNPENFAGDIVAPRMTEIGAGIRAATLTGLRPATGSGIVERFCGEQA